MPNDNAVNPPDGNAANSPDGNAANPPAAAGPAGVIVAHPSPLIGGGGAAPAAPTPGVWRNWYFLTLLFVMLLGMLAKAGYDWARGGQFHLIGLVVPLCVSPMVFALVVQQTVNFSTMRDLVLVHIFSFQNGFFWQTLLGQIDQSMRGGSGNSDGAFIEMFQDMLSGILWVS